MNHLNLEVRYTMKSGCREQFLSEIKPLADIIRREDGCVRYEYICPAEDGNLIVLYETWETAEHQQVHQQQPHMAELMKIKAKYVMNTAVVKL